MSTTILLPNRQDYYRFFWWFLVAMLLLAAGLFRWMLQLSALALLLYVLVVWSIQKAFVYQLIISSNKVILKKCFGSFCYWKRSYTYQHIAVDDFLKTYRFVDSKSYCPFEIQQSSQQLHFIFTKKEIIITHKKAIQIFEHQFFKILSKKDVRSYVVN